MSASAPGAEGYIEEDVVVVGGGIIGASISYHLAARGVRALVVERSFVGCAASGKAGGFLARTWGDGSPTAQLHTLGFDMHAELAKTLGLRSYRAIPTLRVRTRPGGARNATRAVPWLDGDEVVSSSLLDADTAQVTPLELTTRLMEAAVANGARVLIGCVTGVERGPTGAISAVRLGDGTTVRCKMVVFAMGPWSVLVEDWLGLSVPLEGIRSASIVYRGTAAVTENPAALFCGEDERYGTHLEIYPRSDGELYVCGIGGSDYVSGARLRPGGDTESQERVAVDASRVSAARAVRLSLRPPLLAA